MMQPSRALVLGLALLSSASAHARHRDHDADPVNAAYGSVNHCGNQRSSINGAYSNYTNNALFRGNQTAISFPVNAGGVGFYDARQGGRFVGNQVGIGGYNAAQINVVNGYNPYGSINQVNPQIVQYQSGYGNGYNNGYVNNGYVAANNGAYVGVNPWNGYAGNTYNGYTYTPQPAVGNFYNNNNLLNNGVGGNCRNGNGNVFQNGARRGIGNGGYGNRWQFRR